MAGALAAYCLKLDQTPASVLESAERLEDFQGEISRLGVLIDWSGSTAPVPEDW